MTLCVCEFGRARDLTTPLKGSAMTMQGANSPGTPRQLRFRLLANLSFTLASYNCRTRLDQEPQGGTALYVQHSLRPGTRVSVGAVEKPDGWAYVWPDGHCPAGDLDAAARQIVRLLSA
jgi:hypothetical protein